VHTIVLVRMHRDQQTRSYVQRRTEQGLGKKDIIRWLKRAVAREVYHHLRPATALAQPGITASLTSRDQGVDGR
jgi:hypothetical protein